MIQGDEIDIWIERVGGSPAAPDVALLDAGEHLRMERFARAEDQILFASAHAGLRRILSRYAAVDPTRWRFASDSRGRPEVAEPSDAAWIRFNLTHTRGLFAVVVAREREVGIDAEHLDRGTDVMEVAARHFAPGEIEALRAAADGAARRALFFDIWTLKEAYLKARGAGLSVALDGFWFRMEDPIRIHLTGGHGDVGVEDPAGWQFERITPGPAHRGAVAARRRPGESLCMRRMGADRENAVAMNSSRPAAAPGVVAAMAPIGRSTCSLARDSERIPAASNVEAAGIPESTRRDRSR